MDLDQGDKKIINSELDSQFEELIRITSKLRRYSLYILITLVISIACFAVFAVYNSRLGIYEKRSLTSADLILFTYAILIPICGIVLLFMFNNLRNRGMITYEELTDEIDWGNNRIENLRRPPIKSRIIIKQFLRATDLPFTSGANGQAFYFVLFVLLTIAAILLKTLT